MKLKALGVAILVTLAWHGPALAQGSIEERLAKMEQRIRYLEERVAAQDQVIVEKERQISKLSEQEDAWFNGLEIGGVVELEGAYASPYEGDSTTEVAVATVELAVAAEIDDWVGAEIVLSEDEGINVDTATLTIGPPDGPWSFTGGQQTLPFGTFETTLISDPLTLELGETSDAALLFGVSSDQFYGSFFALNDEDNPGGARIGNFGAGIGFAMEHEESEWGADLAYVNDLGNSDSLQGTSAERIPGWAIGARARYGNVSLIGEYLAALEAFQADELAIADRGAEPSAWMVEAAYDFSLAGKDATAALGYQGTDEALGLELPERRLLAGLSVGVAEQVGLGVELSHDNDYGTADGGTGKSARTVTVQLGAEF